jgi:hypothetical protein
MKRLRSLAWALLLLVTGMWIGTNLAGVPLGLLFAERAAVIVIATAPLRDFWLEQDGVPRRAHPVIPRGEHTLFPDLRLSGRTTSLAVHWRLPDGRAGVVRQDITLVAHDRNCLFVLWLDSDGNPSTPARGTLPPAPFWQLCDFYD